MNKTLCPVSMETSCDHCPASFSEEAEHTNEIQLYTWNASCQNYQTHLSKKFSFQQLHFFPQQNSSRLCWVDIRSKFLWGWWGPGTGSERGWVPQPWEHSRSGWLWAAWSSGRLQELGHLKVSSSPNHSIILKNVANNTVRDQKMAEDGGSLVYPANEALSLP